MKKYNLSKTDYGSVTSFDEHGNILRVDKTSSTFELWELHEYGKCTAFCNFCWEEAMEYIKEQNDKH